MVSFTIVCITIGLGIFSLIFLYLRCCKTIHVNSSLIAGFSLAYVFLDVLPEIIHEFPVFHAHVESPPFFFIMLGFATQHLIEKYILQRVDKNTQKQARELIKKENELKFAEHNYEIALTEEVVKKNIDKDFVLNCADNIFLLLEQQNKLNGEIKQMEQKISVDISKDLIKLRFFSDFIYEFFIGIALIGIMAHDMISGIFFFIYAFSHAIVENKKHHEKIFTDLDIEVELCESKPQKILTSLSILLGVIVGIIFNLIFETQLEIIFIMLSFIAGLIFHEILHHMPEKEKGNSSHFISGMLIFCAIFFTTKFLF